MIPKRSYQQACAIARALDIVGERWTLLVIRELALGPRRYTDLLADLPGIATNLLADRLAALEQRGLIARRVLPPPAAATVYELTDRGRMLEPVLLALGTFGAGLGPPPARAHKRPRWTMFALKRLYRGAPHARTIAWFVDQDGWTVGIGGPSAVVSDGAPATADLTLRITREAQVAWLMQGASAAELERGGGLARVGPASMLNEVAAAFGVRP